MQKCDSYIQKIIKKQFNLSHYIYKKRIAMLRKLFPQRQTSLVQIWTTLVKS